MMFEMYDRTPVPAETSKTSGPVVVTDGFGRTQTSTRTGNTNVVVTDGNFGRTQTSTRTTSKSGGFGGMIGILAFIVIGFLCCIGIMGCCWKMMFVSSSSASTGQAPGQAVYTGGHYSQSP